MNMQNSISSKKIAMFMQNNVFVVFLLVLIVCACFFVPNFATKTNLLNVFIQISINGLLATGMTYVIITGGIDLSVGSVAALSGIAATAILTRMPKDTSLLVCVLVTIAVAIVVGTLCGSFIGAAVAKLKIVPFIATFVVYSAARGFAYIYTHSKPIYELPDSFSTIGVGYFMGVPILGILLVVTLLVALFIERKTVVGRHIFAVGSNEEVAKLSGVKVTKIIMGVYIACSCLAALGGICLASRLGSGQPSAANGYELHAIAAVAMGGTSMSGGSGSIMKTVTGITTIGIINNCLSLLRVDSYWQPVAMGIIIFAAVTFDQLKVSKK